MPKISVIMSVYNEVEKYLRLSIESILHQTETDFEYIIILDNPENVKARELLTQYEKNDKRVKVFYNEKNVGLTESLNRALEKTCGKYVARMDADDIAESNRLERQLHYMKKHNLQIVGCSMRRISEAGEIVNSFTNKSYSPRCIQKLLLYDDCVAHPSWFLERDIYIMLNGYRDIYACEDYDFLLRAVEKKIAIGICDEVLMNYRINTAGISRTNALRQMLTSDYLRKNVKRIEQIKRDDVELYLKKHLNEKNEMNYERAIKMYKEMLDKLKRKNILSILCILKILWISPYIGMNIRNVICMQYIKRMYNKS